jgi:hypothetical protein
MAVVLCVLLLAAVAYNVADRWLTEVLELEPQVARSTLAGALRWITLALSVCVAALGVYLLDIGRRVVSAQRYPPPGFAVVKDTEVVEGHSAKARGLWIQLFSAVLIIAAVALLLGAHFIANRLS